MEVQVIQDTTIAHPVDHVADRPGRHQGQDGLVAFLANDKGQDHQGQGCNHGKDRQDDDPPGLVRQKTPGSSGVAAIDQIEKGINDNFVRVARQEADNQTLNELVSDCQCCNDQDPDHIHKSSIPR